MQNARAKQVAALLKACAKSRDLETGIKIHQQALRSGFASNTLVANTLVSMYSKCGSIAQARAAFDAIAAKDIVSWNSIILGYVLNGDSQLALHLFSSMQHPPWNIPPDSRTYVAALSACSTMAAAAAAASSSLKSSLLETGTRIHLQARSSGDVADIFIASKLIDMYAKCGSMIEARRVADRLPGFNLVSWTALLLGYAENDQPELALELFSKMDGISAPRPDGPAFVAAFVACSGLARREAGAKIRSLERAMVLHSRAAKQGFCSSLYVAAGAIGMYRSCGSLIDARYVFDKMDLHDVVVWNSLILGCVENGEAEIAMELFLRIETANARTFVAALMACVSIAARESGERAADGTIVKAKSLETGRSIHSRAAAGGYQSEVFVANSLIDMYAKCGSLDEAREILETIEVPNAVSCTALLLGYTNSGKCRDALELFRRKNFKPDAPAFVAALMACGSLIDLRAGRSIQAESYRHGVDRDEEIVSASLIDFYSRCGMMPLAQMIFDSVSIFRENATAAWNSLIAGYSHRGEIGRVFDLLQQMPDEGIRPNAITFYVLLSACSHAGLVDRGKRLFQAMTSGEFGIAAESQHYSCMIDLLGRANRLDEVIELLGSMPKKPDEVTWMTVLSSAWKWKNVEVGELAFRSVLELNDQNAAAYVLMSNIYDGVAFSDNEPVDRSSPPSLRSIEIDSRSTPRSILDRSYQHQRQLSSAERDSRANLPTSPFSHFALAPKIVVQAT